MPLKACRECGHSVSREAKVCPGCGIDTPGKSLAEQEAEKEAEKDRDAFQWVVLVAIVLGMVWLVSNCT